MKSDSMLRYSRKCSGYCRSSIWMCGRVLGMEGSRLFLCKSVRKGSHVHGFSLPYPLALALYELPLMRLCAPVSIPCTNAVRLQKNYLKFCFIPVVEARIRYAQLLPRCEVQLTALNQLCECKPSEAEVIAAIMSITPAAQFLAIFRTLAVEWIGYDPLVRVCPWRKDVDVTICRSK